MESIVVVDDEEAIREVVSTMLESKGYHCTAVHNGRVAQDQVKKATPDLVLSDMIMPEMDGIRLLEWMRQYDPEVPVIMVTAIHDISTALEGIRRGVFDCRHKPFEKDQLLLSVVRALQHRRLIIENRNYQRNLEQLVEERTAQLTAKHVELEQSYDDTLEALGSALDLKDAETEGHCQRVTAFCISIARCMPVLDAYLPILARAAFLHDIGKMAIPDSTLRKPGPLDEAEKRKMREHCEIEGAGLAQDAVWDSHLANIVEESGTRQNGQIRVWHGHASRDGYTKGGNALAVAFGFGILQVQGAAEGLKRVGVGLLEFHVLGGELRGALLDQLFKVALVVSVFDDHPPVLQCAPNAQKELILLERLQDVIIGPAANRFEGPGNVMNRCNHDHRHFRIVLPHPFQQPDAVHLRHNHVAQDKVGSCLFDLVLRNAAVVYGRAVIAF